VAVVQTRTIWHGMDKMVKLIKNSNILGTDMLYVSVNVAITNFNKIEIVAGELIASDTVQQWFLER